MLGSIQWPATEHFRDSDSRGPGQPPTLLASTAAAHLRTRQEPVTIARHGLFGYFTATMRQECTDNTCSRPLVASIGAALPDDGRLVADVGASGGVEEPPRRGAAGNQWQPAWGQCTGFCWRPFEVSTGRGRLSPPDQRYGVGELSLRHPTPPEVLGSFRSARSERNERAFPQRSRWYRVAR